MRIAVAKVNEIDDGCARAVEAGGRQLVLVRRGDEFYALRDICPHQGARLSGGVVSGLWCSEGRGDYRIEREGEILRCPWHNWQFDVKSGRCLHSEKTRVAAYPVEVDGGDVFVNL